MNERINILAEQAGFYVSECRLEILAPDSTTDNVTEALRGFAELIIRDCMDVVDGYTKGRTFDTHYDAVEQIEALFGIKHNGDDE
jgi:hypothetical protein